MFAAEEFAISWLCLCMLVRVCACVYVSLCSDCFTRITNLCWATRGQIFFRQWFFKLLKCKDQSCHCIWFIWWVGKLSAACGFIPNCKKLQHCWKFSLLGCTDVWKVLFAMLWKIAQEWDKNLSGFTRNPIIHDVTVKKTQTNYTGNKIINIH